MNPERMFGVVGMRGKGFLRSGQEDKRRPLADSHRAALSPTRGLIAASHTIRYDRPMNTYDTFVQELKKRALIKAKLLAAPFGPKQAENEAVHLAGHGMALVSVDEANQDPEGAALRFDRDKLSKGLVEYNETTQWALCPLSPYEAFLRLVDVGATVRDELQHQGTGDKIRQDAKSRIQPADLEEWSMSPLTAAINFLTVWPDLGHFSAAPWLRKAAKRKAP